MPFTDIENAIAAIERGELVIVVDDADRENEGDLIMAAETMTPEAMAFMIRHTSGVICMPVEGEPPRRAAAAADGRRQHREPAHRVHRVGRRPPRHHHRHLRRRPGHHGARRPRPRHQARGPRPARPHLPAALPRGRRAQARRSHRGRGRPRPPGRACTPPGCSPRSSTTTAPWRGCRELEAFAAEHGLQLISIADLIRYRRHREKLVRRVSEARIPTRHGDFTGYVFESLARRHRAHGVRVRRGRGQGERARARALRVPHRRRVRLDALRLRPAARRRDGAASPAEGTRRRRVPARPRGPRHRSRPQDPRLHAPGPGPRHRRGQRRARVPGRLARVRHRLADARRPRRLDHAAS